MIIYYYSDAISQSLQKDMDANIPNLSESRLTITTPPSVSPIASPADDAPPPRMVDVATSALTLSSEPSDIGGLTRSMTESFTALAFEVLNET